MILLDTHAAIWLAQGHKRATPLARFGQLFLSPISVLEVQFLTEAGRLRLTGGRSAIALADDDRWRMDEPPSLKWFAEACAIGWTRDPFDRLLVAHARVRRWRLATSDHSMLENLATSDLVAL